MYAPTRNAVSVFVTIRNALESGIIRYVLRWRNSCKAASLLRPTRCTSPLVAATAVSYCVGLHSCARSGVDLSSSLLRHNRVPPPLLPHLSVTHRALAWTLVVMAVAPAAVVVGRGTKRRRGSHSANIALPINKSEVNTRETEAEFKPAAASEDRSDSSRGQPPLHIPLIKRYEKEAIADRQHLNHITTLLVHIEHERQRQLEPPPSSHSSVSAAALHTTTAAYQSLFRILEQYVEAGELLLAGAADRSSTTLAGQLHVWLHSQYTRYVACSLTFLRHSHTPLQLSALQALMALVKLSTRSQQPDTAASLLATGLFVSAVHAALQSPQYDSLHDTLASQYLLPYIDLRVAALRAIKAKLRQAAAQHNDRPTTFDTTGTVTVHEAAVVLFAHLDTTLHNSLTLLLDLSRPDTLAPTASFTDATVSASALKASLSATYMAYLSVPHSAASYKRVLEHVDSHVLPNVANPLLLADFLTDSFHIGGIVSLLSLASLFHLMTKHNLDYPHFYHKLYSLCTPALTLSKHRSRLFVLLSKFLSSAYLPSSLVAAFCKRLARLAVVGGGGVDGSVELLRLVWGLVRRNRSMSGLVWGQHEVDRDSELQMESLTDFLLKRQTELAADSEARERKTSERETDSEEKGGQHDDMFDDGLSDDDEHEASTHNVSNGGTRADPLAAIQSAALSSTVSPTAIATDTTSTTAATTTTTNKSSPASTLTTDPFLALSDDPVGSAASASTLWEVRSLTRHYAPAVRALASLFYAANAPKGELDAVGVGAVGDSAGYEGMMRKEMERRKNQKVAVTYGKRATLFEDGDIVNSNFSWS